jgi:hypothetical protein
MLAFAAVADARALEMLRRGGAAGCVGADTSEHATTRRASAAAAAATYRRTGKVGDWSFVIDDPSSK